MVAPVVLLGLAPVFYPISKTGLPLLGEIPEATARQAACILVPHYFGLPRSLGDVRNWCDQYDTVLIEDCAHAYYGTAGERPVGAWGDFATASLTKFFPVVEGGILASARHPIPPLELDAGGLKVEAKGFFDILHLATTHDRMRGLGAILDLARARRNGVEPMPAKDVQAPQTRPTANELIIESDMDRIEHRRLASTNLALKCLPEAAAAASRSQRFNQYAETVKKLPGVSPLMASAPPASAPYAFPLWVDDADRVYHELRIAGAPVFRWDRLWPTTPSLDGDQGLLWSKHMLQFLCHQSLTSDELAWTLDAIRQSVCQ